MKKTKVKKKNYEICFTFLHVISLVIHLHASSSSHNYMTFHHSLVCPSSSSTTATTNSSSFFTIKSRFEINLNEHWNFMLCCCYCCCYCEMYVCVQLWTDHYEKIFLPSLVLYTSVSVSPLFNWATDHIRDEINELI